jgi:queuosine precursor transporter
VSDFSQAEPSRRLFVSLSAVFVSCLLLGDVIGGKTILTPLGPISVGIIPFPVTFLLTDVVNDFYGRRGARFLTFLGFWMAVLAWIILQVSTWLPVDPSSYFTQAEFQKVFGGSAQLFVASMLAYMVGQLLDIHVFQFWKALTESRHLWLRATGSTVVSQLIDTVTINVVFWSWTAASAPDSFLGRLTAGERWTWIAQKVMREYGIKLVVAIALTPAVYAIHGWIIRRLGLDPAPPERRGVPPPEVGS